MKSKELDETRYRMDARRGEGQSSPPELFPTTTGMIRHFLRGSLHCFLLSVLFSMLVSLFDLINPKVIGFTVDSIIGDGKPALPAFVPFPVPVAFFRHHLGAVALTVAALALAAAVFRYLSKLMNTRGSETLLETMRNELFSHILRLPFTWYNENQTGDIIQRCTSDVETVRAFVSEQLTQLLRVVILIVMALVFMAGINGTMTLISFLFIPVIVLYSFVFHHQIGATFEKADSEEGRLSSMTQENLTGVRVVRAFGRERYEQERFERQNSYYTSIWVRLMRILSVYWSFGDFFSGLQTLTAIVLGAVFCVRGVITEGDFIAFSTYNSMLVWPVRSLGRVISEMAKVGVSVDRIRAVMNASEEPMDAPDRNAQALSGKTADPFAGDICFENVHFRYGSGSDTEVLRDVSFRVKAGTTTGILGGTGSGKSTIAWLLDRLYDLPEGCGRITIGGVDIASMSRREVRAHVGLVLQEPFLFSRTLYDNIRIAENGAEVVTPESGEGIPEDRKRGSGRPAASDPVRAAASDACLDKTIASFPDGYDTVVGERGVTLSGGQKQRTAIAQTLIRHTPVLVFDDSLSAVDAETDAEIRRALRERTRNATVLLIAHRITTLMQADQIIVLEHGRIAQQGTHEELIRQPGIYQTIYRLQVSQGLMGNNEEEVKRDGDN